MRPAFYIFLGTTSAIGNLPLPFPINLSDVIFPKPTITENKVENDNLLTSCNELSFRYQLAGAIKKLMKV